MRSSIGLAAWLAAFAFFTASCAEGPIEPTGPAASPDTASNDSLYVGDGVDNSVKRFDATTGQFEGLFVRANSGGLHGPRGLVFAPTTFSAARNLLVADQNVHRPFPGEILEYDGTTGAFLDALVSRKSPSPPFTPRGIVVLGDTLYVADFGNPAFTKPPPTPVIAGSIRTYDASGTFGGNLSLGKYDSTTFFPRGLVVGADGLLYVTNIPNGPESGQVLRFDPVSGFKDVFIDSMSCACDLRRPEGLVFGPDGRLYVTSFRANSNDTDKILIFDGNTFVDEIDLDVVGKPRAFAQALLFGPNGCLFVPINTAGNNNHGTSKKNPFTGQVRRYDVLSKNFVAFVQSASSGGPLGVPWYLTFHATNPATLVYEGDTSGTDGCPIPPM